ncbi:MAG: hypothetical protein Q9172_003418 [Xanthocarpia lactea]
MTQITFPDFTAKTLSLADSQELLDRANEARSSPNPPKGYEDGPLAYARESRATELKITLPMWEIVNPDKVIGFPDNKRWCDTPLLDGQPIILVRDEAAIREFISVNTLQRVVEYHLDQFTSPTPRMLRLAPHQHTKSIEVLPPVDAEVISNRDEATDATRASTKATEGTIEKTEDQNATKLTQAAGIQRKRSVSMSSHDLQVPEDRTPIDGGAETSRPQPYKIVEDLEGTSDPSPK